MIVSRVHWFFKTLYFLFLAVLNGTSEPFHQAPSPQTSQPVRSECRKDWGTPHCNRPHRRDTVRAPPRVSVRVMVYRAPRQWRGVTQGAGREGGHTHGTRRTEGCGNRVKRGARAGSRSSSMRDSRDSTKSLSFRDSISLNLECGWTTPTSPSNLSLFGIFHFYPVVPLTSPPTIQCVPSPTWATCTRTTPRPPAPCAPAAAPTRWRP